MAGCWTHTLSHDFDLAEGSPAGKSPLRECQRHSCQSVGFMLRSCEEPAEPADPVELLEQNLNHKVHKRN